MNPLQTLSAITATREPQTGLKRLTDVKNIGPDSAKEAAVRVAYWLVLFDIPTCGRRQLKSCIQIIGRRRRSFSGSWQNDTA